MTVQLFNSLIPCADLVLKIAAILKVSSGGGWGGQGYGLGERLSITGSGYYSHFYLEGLKKEVRKYLLNK